MRVATYINQIPTALEMVKDAQDKGYETTLNLMAVSTVPERELNEGLELMAQSGTKAIYVVDSFGSLYSEQVHYLRQEVPVCVPRHRHRSGHACPQQSPARLRQYDRGDRAGLQLLDATMAGLGRGAGNCPMELLLGFLHNPKYDQRPVLRCVQTVSNRCARS